MPWIAEVRARGSGEWSALCIDGFGLLAVSRDVALRLATKRDAVRFVDCFQTYAKTYVEWPVGYPTFRVRKVRKVEMP